MTLKWDVTRNQKVFVWAGDTPATLIGFSNVTQILKFEHKVGDEKPGAKKHALHDSLLL